MWIKNGQVFKTHSEIRQACPNISFPVDITNQMITDAGFEPVAQIAPVFDPLTQIATEAAPVLTGEGWAQEWIITNKSAEVIAAALVQAKAEKNQQINQWRAAANQTTFPHAGKLIACDALSRSDIDAVAGSIALFGKFPAGFPNAWKATDNSYIPLPDVAAFKSMHASLTRQGTLNFGQSQTRKATLAAATTLAQVNAITWES